MPGPGAGPSRRSPLPGATRGIPPMGSAGQGPERGPLMIRLLRGVVAGNPEPDKPPPERTTRISRGARRMPPSSAAPPRGGSAALDPLRVPPHRRPHSGERPGLTLEEDAVPAPTTDRSDLVEPNAESRYRGDARGSAPVLPDARHAPVELPPQGVPAHRARRPRRNAPYCGACYVLEGERPPARGTRTG